MEKIGIRELGKLDPTQDTKHLALLLGLTGIIGAITGPLALILVILLGLFLGGQG